MAKIPNPRFTILPISGIESRTFAPPVVGVTAVWIDHIRCVPTPCKDGWHYCPDWYGLTELG